MHALRIPGTLLSEAVHLQKTLELAITKLTEVELATGLPMPLSTASQTIIFVSRPR